jgi:microcystin-dependent protein
MADPFVGQIMIFAFDFCPPGWAHCNGQVLPVGQNQTLFSLLGTTYGGNGTTTFGLPDLQGRLPLHADTANPLGRAEGADGVLLTESEMGPHDHGVRGSSGMAELGAAGKLLAMGAAGGRGSVTPYREPVDQSNLQPLIGGTIGTSSGGAPHDNMQPSLVLTFCIALFGTFPEEP